MTDSMVERVARAIWANTADGQVFPQWETIDDHYSNAIRAQARAAIEAMLVPTPTMVQAGQDDMTGMEICREADCADCKRRMTAGWQGMVTAALED